jgi:hypothetical protein
MSYGMTPAEFVRQVYYTQEKVILDFRPTDDKYKEVLMEANLVLQELQKEEDWSWLRKRLVLGSTRDLPHGYGQIPEYHLPEWVYKPSTLHNDCVRLYRTLGHCRHHSHECQCCGECINEWACINIPYTSLGNTNSHIRRGELGAVVIDDILTFNRPFMGDEKNRIAVADMQRRLEPLHICDSNCEVPCKKIEKLIFREIPDPNYLVVKTAALHAEGSPPAQGRLQSLQDQAQKLLSAMRQNDASATEPDYLEWDDFCCIEAV